MRVLDIFFEEPTKQHNLKEISRKIKLAHTSVKRELDKLKEKKLISTQEEKKGRRIFPIYRANLENKKFFN